MKSSTTTKKPTTYVWLAIANGVFDGNQTSQQVVLFLASNGGWWATFGPHHTQKWWAYRLCVSEATLKRALADLLKQGIIEVDRRKARTTYFLTESFMDRCQWVVELAKDLTKAAVLYEQYPDATQGELALIYQQLSEQEREELSQQNQDVVTIKRLKVEPRGGSRLSPVEAQGCASLYREDQEKGFRRTAEAARPDGRDTKPTQEGTPMERNIDWDEDTPKRRPKGNPWGRSAERVEGESQDRPQVPKVIKHKAPPKTKDVLAVKAYFQSKLLAFSDVRHVPLWEQVGKMHTNIDFLLKQGHTTTTIEGAIDLFASQVTSLYFQGESLWDKFFAQRDEYIRLAAIHSIGSRGGPRESQIDKSRRLMAYQQQQKDAQS